MPRILIDNLSPNQKFAWTVTAEKIVANRNLLRTVQFGNSVKIAGIDGGTLSLFSIGRYITVVRINSDGVPNKMYFFDYNWEISKAELQLLLQGAYTKELEMEWFNIQWNLYSTFKAEMDTVKLFKK